MLIKRGGDIKSGEITDQALYLNRRAFMTGSLAGAAALALAPRTARAAAPAITQQPANADAMLYGQATFQVAAEGTQESEPEELLRRSLRGALLERFGSSRRRGRDFGQERERRGDRHQFASLPARSIAKVWIVGAAGHPPERRRL